MTDDILDKPGSLLVPEIEDEDITVLDVLLFHHLRDDCEQDGHYHGTIYENYKKIDEQLTDFQYCFCSTRVVCYFCKKCQYNFLKLKFFLKENNLKALVRNWDSPFDETKVSLKPIPPDPQTYDEFLERYPHLKDKKYITKAFDHYFNEPLDKYLEELKDYEYIQLGGYFNQSLKPLSQLKNLKGVSFGCWFKGSLNDLADCEQLECVQVLYRYVNFGKHFICPKILAITFRV